jgi:uncharacterized protein YhbP (UPF0306 family)
VTAPERRVNAAAARRIIDALMYMTLATADADGRPWATPVWFAHDEYSQFVWVSDPSARHSRNIAARAEVGIVIFDSTVPIGGAEAVYVEASAEQLRGAEAERAVEVFSRRSTEVEGREWTLAEVTASAPLRLYRATASATYVLGPGDRRIQVDLGD